MHPSMNYSNLNMEIGGKRDFLFLFVTFYGRIKGCSKYAANPMNLKVTLMRRIFTLLLCAALLLSLAACGSSEEPAPTDATAAATRPAEILAPTDAPTEAPTEAPVQTAVPDIIQLVNNDDAAVHITKIENNEHLGMQLRIQCENRTDRALMFSWDMVSVCGFMYDPMWAEEVGPGKTSNSTIELDTYALEQMGVVSVDEITFTLRVFDSENWMEEPLVQELCTIYPTGLNAETARFPARAESSGQVVVAEDENVRFVVEWADAEDASEYTVYVYMENKTDRNLMYAWDMVSVNDMMVDPFWATVVSAGKKACSEITFYRSELADNGIEEVESIEFTLLVSDYDNWEGGNLLEKSFIYQP